jgi:hypothetical protein
MSFPMSESAFSGEVTNRVAAKNAVEVRIFWGESLLDLVELSPPRAFYVGDGSRAPFGVDFTVPDAGFDRIPLLEMDSGVPVITPPPGAVTTRRQSGVRRQQNGEALTERNVALDAATSVDVRLGSLVFSFREGAREKSCPRSVADGDRRPLAFFGLAFFIGAAVMAMMAYFEPPLGLTDDESMDKDQLYLMQSYLDASSEREHEREPEKADGDSSAAANSPAEKAMGEAGKMGRRDSTATNRRASGTAPGAELRAATSRAEAITQAQNFGLIGLLASGSASSTVAPFDDAGVGQMAAAGGFFGDEIGDIAGMGGLAPLGIGEGGGGRAAQIGLASIGTCHGEECGAGRWGISGSHGGPGHVAKAPSLHMGQTVVERGSIPADVIQRIVRQSFGRFRGCYEAGLQANPTLEGRVTARFVIGRDGSVATVQSGGTDLPDPKVVSCVLNAYRSLSFPAPKDGVVAVTYPLTFSPAT